MNSHWLTLFQSLESGSKTSEKVNALRLFFQEAPPEDKIWLIALFTGRKPKRPVTVIQLKEWASSLAGIDLWLFDECYQVVGDLAETISLVLHNEAIQESGPADTVSLSSLMEQILEMSKLTDEEKKKVLLNTWAGTSKEVIFFFTKFITGGFRIGVSKQLVVQALAAATEMSAAEIDYKLTGNWSPVTTTFESLILETSEKADSSKPYPFYLAYPVENSVEDMGSIKDWLIEYKWDGIRIQLVKRNSTYHLWSRGEELITDRFPELETDGLNLPDGTVLDGELIAFKDQQILQFSELQKRIGRKKPGKKIVEETPCAILAYDILEFNGIDLRNTNLIERRVILEECLERVELKTIKISPLLNPSGWAEASDLRENSRFQKAEGLMIKKRDSTYKSGRKRGDWWKWKTEPFTIDAVLIYAQKGHGRRADLYTDYTFGVWNEGKLQTIAKAYSGLTDAEIEEVDRFVKKNTLERFGPVRTVTPELVFEIGFEGVQASSRHKSGVAVRFPRIIRWRKDKKADEANTLMDLKSLAGI